ncbi:hypothetical protein CN918_31875 [Priestia megaterium]|nr:hypothetical protein CN918_31875 [Priestia megaterium]
MKCGEEMSFLNRRGRKNEQQIETGLKIVPQEGNFLIIQMQTSVNGELDEIMLVESYPLAEVAKRELESLVDWNTTEDVYQGLVVQEGYDYKMTQKMNAIIDKYSPSWYTKDIGSLPNYEEENDMRETVYAHEESSEELAVAVDNRPAIKQTPLTAFKVKKQGVYEYEIKDENGQIQNVMGHQVVDGLAIRRVKGETHAIDHMPSGQVFRIFNTEERALKCIEEMNKLTRWDHFEADRLFFEDKEFVTYMRALGKAIDLNKEIPDVSPIVKMRTEYYSQFFSINPENGDFKRFCKAIKKLTNMVGLETVKREVKELLYSMMGRVRNEGKVTFKDSHMHMVFVGPPGTGKTEIARVISEIYGSLGYLPKGHLVEVDSEDLKGNYEGHTGDLVKEKVLEAMGGTLLIDEAYGLVGGQFGKEAVTTLIKLLDDKKGQFMTIFTGYPADIEKLLNANPGFPSRIEKRLTFNDYTVDQLTQIIQHILKSTGHILKDDVVEEIHRAVKRISKQGSVSGSARTAGKMAHAIAKELNIRIGKDSRNEILETNVVTVEDVKLATDPNAKKETHAEREKMLEEVQLKIQKVIGLENVKRELQNILTMIEYDDDLYRHDETSQAPVKHMLFKGPPGTGKTTFARLVAEYFKAIGALSSGHLVEVTRQDLVGEYIGHTAEKTMEVINRAKGGVLLVDEAPTLAEGGEKDYGREAINAFIKPMEEVEDLVVIFAGYAEQMGGFLNVNPGMKSRIPYHFEFPNYNPEELHQLTILQLEQTFNLQLGEGVNEKLAAYVNNVYKKANGNLDNGRWARNVAQKMKFNLANRLKSDERPRHLIPLEEKKTVLPADIPTSAI